MAILKIARMGHPVLMAPAQAVPDPEAPEIRNLVADMVETMIDADGVGLAAPQVHVPLRVVVFHVPGPRIAEEEDPDRARDLEDKGLGEVPLTVLINPEITPLGEDTIEGFEGCLSLPGMRGQVRRHARIRYRATGLDGQPIEREAVGFHARVVQHECDHLDGILYPMRMDDLATFGYVEEMAPPASDAPEEPEEPEV